MKPEAPPTSSRISSKQRNSTEVSSGSMYPLMPPQCLLEATQQWASQEAATGSWAS